MRVRADAGGVIETKASLVSSAAGRRTKISICLDNSASIARKPAKPASRSRLAGSIYPQFFSTEIVRSKSEQSLYVCTLMYAYYTLVCMHIIYMHTSCMYVCMCSLTGSVNPSGQGPEKRLGTRNEQSWHSAVVVRGRSLSLFLHLLNFISF